MLLQEIRSPIPLVYTFQSKLSAAELENIFLPLMNGAVFLVLEMDLWNFGGSAQADLWSWLGYLRHQRNSLAHKAADFGGLLGRPDDDSR